MAESTSAPILSTPDSRIFEQPDVANIAPSKAALSEEQLAITYEIERTVSEIRTGRWKRIALQFPDHMLSDAPWVFRALSRGLRSARRSPRDEISGTGIDGANGVDHTTDALRQLSVAHKQPSGEVPGDVKIFILADTSYGACCVDEVAAEHADADVVVHYGRSCLSPTARLPAVYVFTNPPLDLDQVCQSFKETYPENSSKVILTADIPYMSRIKALESLLRSNGYSDVFSTELIHDTSSPIPNRTVPAEATTQIDALKSWNMFHVSEPPEALLLTLSSRIGSLHIYPTKTDEGSIPRATEASSMRALRRRYATLIKLATVPIFGILINTLSVKNYMEILAHVKKRIAEAGKKSYTFVVGKVNAAKVANFSEVGGWVVIGCWESSLLESKDFWKPVISPFELELALTGDSERVWSGAWSSDFQAILNKKGEQAELSPTRHAGEGATSEEVDESSGEESAPPEFDLRTGRYVSHSRPMKKAGKVGTRAANGKPIASQALAKSATQDVASMGGIVSPAAEFFKNKRTWQGLGSDFELAYDENGAMKPVEGARMEAGRKGIAKGILCQQSK